MPTAKTIHTDYILEIKNQVKNDSLATKCSNEERENRGVTPVPLVCVCVCVRVCICVCSLSRARYIILPFALAEEINVILSAPSPCALSEPLVSRA